MVRFGGLFRKKLRGLVTVMLRTTAVISPYQGFTFFVHTSYYLRTFFGLNVNF